ncbi:MAG TPA: RDD family protein [Clostridia bacterium]|nr:RDD family protein [Clostridia bacterium]
MDKGQELTNVYSQYSDQALRKILYVSPETYEEHALSAAKNELCQRFEAFFSTYSGIPIPFRVILREVTFNEVSDELLLYIQKKSLIQEYKQVFEKLLLIESDLDTSFGLNVLQSKNGKLNVEVIDISSNELVISDLLTWNEWLNAKVKQEQILKYGIERIIAISLIKMTTNGFYEGESRQQLSEMEKYYNGVKDVKGDKQLTQIGSQDESYFLAHGILEYRAEKKQKPIQETLNHDEEYKRGKVPQVRPWVRFFARMIDYVLIYSIIIFFLKIMTPGLFALYQSVTYISIPALVWLIIEAILISTIGTTPGKWILRITVRNSDGSKLNFKNSLLRSLMVFSCGYGLSLPYVNIITSIISFIYLKSNKKTLWDKKMNLQVTHEKIDTWRGSVAAVVLIFLPVLIFFFIKKHII